MKTTTSNVIKTAVIASLAFVMFLVFACSDNKDSSTGPSGQEDTTYTFIFDDDIDTGDSVTFTAGINYLLSGFVFVDSGAVLTIEPGTFSRHQDKPDR